MLESKASVRFLRPDVALPLQTFVRFTHNTWVGLQTHTHALSYPSTHPSHPNHRTTITFPDNVGGRYPNAPPA